MCLIIDANRIGDLISKNDESVNSLVLNWMNSSRGCLNYGGQLQKELGTNEKFRRLLVEWNRRGKAFQEERGKVDHEADRLESTGLLQSNDGHVLALAIVSGARVLFSHDEKLKVDFTNSQLLAKPQAKVYCQRSGLPFDRKVMKRVLENAPLCRHRNKLTKK